MTIHNHTYFLFTTRHTERDKRKTTASPIFLSPSRVYSGPGARSEISRTPTAGSPERRPLAIPPSDAVGREPPCLRAFPTAIVGPLTRAIRAAATRTPARGHRARTRSSPIADVRPAAAHRPAPRGRSGPALSARSPRWSSAPTASRCRPEGRESLQRCACMHLDALPPPVPPPLLRTAYCGLRSKCYILRIILHTTYYSTYPTSYDVSYILYVSYLVRTMYYVLSTTY